MPPIHTTGCTAFLGFEILTSGALADVHRNVRDRVASGEPILVFDDSTGKVIDIDLRPDAVEAPNPTLLEPDARGRGRPKLGVKAREVTLLPRQWDWLAGQPGGASATLRRLVDDARRTSSKAPDQDRARREAAYRFMSALAGDLPGFEEASRALFAGDTVRLDAQLAEWPKDVRGFAQKLFRGEADNFA